MNGSDCLVFLVLLLLSEASSVSNEPVKLNVQEHDERLFVHVETVNPLHHFKVEEVYACSSVDLDMEPFSTDRSAMTGCSTPGFMKEMVYQEALAEKLSGTHRVVNKFRASMSGRTLIIHEMMVDARAPVVYIQMHLKLMDENGRLLNGGKCLVYTTRYISLEKSAEPIVIHPARGPEVEALHKKPLPWYYFTIGGVGVALVVVAIISFMVRLPGLRKMWKRKNIISGLDLERGQFVDVSAVRGKKEKESFVRSAINQGWYRN